MRALIDHAFQDRSSSRPGPNGEEEIASGEIGVDRLAAVNDLPGRLAGARRSYRRGRVVVLSTQIVVLSTHLSKRFLAPGNRAFSQVRSEVNVGQVVPGTARCPLS